MPPAGAQDWGHGGKSGSGVAVGLGRGVAVGGGWLRVRRGRRLRNRRGGGQRRGGGLGQRRGRGLRFRPARFNHDGEGAGGGVGVVEVPRKPRRVVRVAQLAGDCISARRLRPPHLVLRAASHEVHKVRVAGHIHAVALDCPLDPHRVVHFSAGAVDVPVALPGRAQRHILAHHHAIPARRRRAHNWRACLRRLRPRRLRRQHAQSQRRARHGNSPPPLPNGSLHHSS
jgi:hypothetical protein